MKVKSTPDGGQGEDSSKSSKPSKPISIANEPQMSQSEEADLSKSNDKKPLPAKTAKKKR
jgi:hypothetical protein